jgi:hypothetical protein
LKAEWLKLNVEPVMHEIIDCTRQTDTKGRRQTLEPGSNVDAVAEQILTHLHNVPDMNTEPKSDVVAPAGLLEGAPLEAQCTLCGAHGAVEGAEEAVTRSPADMARESTYLILDPCQLLLKGLDRRDFVEIHPQARRYGIDKENRL